MKFFIKRPFKHQGKTYSRRDKYVEMPYEDGRPLVRRGKLMLSKQQEEVKNEEILEKTEPDAGKPDRPVKSRKRSRKPSK